jgi:hypothetical protein
MDRWSKWWDWWRGQGVKWEDCTGSDLGTLPGAAIEDVDAEDESEEEEEEDAYSDDDKFPSSDEEESEEEEEEDGDGDGGRRRTSAGSTGTTSSGKEWRYSITRSSRNRHKEELRELVRECQAMEQGRDYSLMSGGVAGAASGGGTGWDPSDFATLLALSGGGGGGGMGSLSDVYSRASATGSGSGSRSGLGEVGQGPAINITLH